MSGARYGILLLIFWSKVYIHWLVLTMLSSVSLAFKT